MANVPTIHAPTTELDSTPLPYQRLDAPLAAFGGRDAAQLQESVGDAAGIFRHYQSLADETAANDALNQYRLDNVKATSAFLGKQGKDAVTAHDSYVMDLDQRKQRLFAGLSPGAQRLVQSHLNGVQANALEVGESHRRSQQLKWSVDSSNATLDTNVQHGVEARNDPALVHEIAEHGVGEIAKLQSVLGWDDVTAANQKTAWYSRFYATVIGKAALENPLVAQKLLEAVKDKIDPDTQTKLIAFVKPRVDNAVVDAGLAKLGKSTGPDGKPLVGAAFVEAAGNLFKDPQLKLLAVSRASAIAAKQQQALDQRRAALAKTLKDLAERNDKGDFSQPIPRAEIEELVEDKEKAKAIIGAFETARINGQLLNGLLTASPDQFATLFGDVRDGRGQVVDTLRSIGGIDTRRTTADAPRDFTHRYNTALNGEQEKTFQAFLERNSGLLERNLRSDLANYDLRGLFLKTGGADLGSDYQINEFKKPNHPTFSSGSIYHGADGFQGGEWIAGDDGKSTFIPNQANIDTLGDKGLAQYFALNHTDSSLHLPAPFISDPKQAERDRELRGQLLLSAKALEDKRNEALRNDGMGFAVEHDDMTRQAMERFNQTRDIKDLQTAIDLGMNFQRRVGSQNPQVLSRSMVDSFATAFRKAPDDAKLQTILPLLKIGDETVVRGALRQLTGAGLPDDLRYALAAAFNKNTNGAVDILRAITTPDPVLNADSRAALLKKMAPAAAHYAANDLMSTWSGNEAYRNQGIKEISLIAKMTRNSTDAHGAIAAVMGNQRPLIDKGLAAVFIPKNADKYQMVDGFTHLRNQLITDDLFYLPDIPGVSPSEMRKLSGETAQREREKARWVGSNITGYKLVLSTHGVVTDASGKVRVFTADQVLGAGKENPIWSRNQNYRQLYDYRSDKFTSLPSDAISWMPQR